MLPYLIAGAIGYGIAKLFEEDEAPKYADGGLVDMLKSLFIKNGFTQDDLQRILEENKNYFNQIEFYDNETIIVYRTIALPRRLVDKFIQLDKQEIGEGIGEYWTLDKEFGRAVWGGGHYEGEETFYITCVGHLNIKDIDWEMMKYAFNDDGWHFGSESEIRGVNGGNAIKVIECNEIYSNGGLIAPNGKPSNLTPEQYKLVRTKAFKQWFGDWQNDPENSSKVVDENGEPLVVYHGTFKRFNKFEKSNRGSYGKGFYFTQNEKTAFDYGNIVLNFFCNIKKPFYLDENSLKEWSEKYYTKNKSILTKKIQKDGYDGVIIQNEIVVFQSNQIKLADGSNTTFDGNNPDIRFDDGGIIISNEYSTDSYDFGNVGNAIIQNGIEVGQIQYDINTNNSISIYLLETLQKGIGAKVINYFFANGVNIIYGDAVDSFDFWKKMGAKFDEFNEDINGYPFTISKEDFMQTKYFKNPDIRFDDGGKVLSYNEVLKKQQTGDYYFDFLFSNENSKFIEETIDIRELRELNGFSDDEDEIEHTISYFNDLGMDEDYEIGRELMNKIVNGIELNPIVVDEEYKVLDGSHRLSAYSELYYYYGYDYPFDGKLKIYKRISN